MKALCAWCGTPIEEPRGRQVFCGTACKHAATYSPLMLLARRRRARAKRDANRPPVPDRACAGCGSPIPRERLELLWYTEVRYCARSCADKSSRARKRQRHRHPRSALARHERMCRGCGGPLPATANPATRYCTGACRRTAHRSPRRRAYRQTWKFRQREIARQNRARTLLCPWCGKEFTTDKPHQKYCSHACTYATHVSPLVSRAYRLRGELRRVPEEWRPVVIALREMTFVLRHIETERENPT